MSGPKLIDTLVRETQGFPPSFKFSKDGQLAYAIYQIEADFNSGITLAAEVFQIVNNELVSLSTFNIQQFVNDIENPFVSVIGGDVNSDFTLFTLTVGTATGENGNGIIRTYLLTQHEGGILIPLSGLSIPDQEIYIKGFAAWGGIFYGNDNGVITVGVKKGDDGSSGSQKSIIYLNTFVELDDTLEVVVTSKEIKGIVTTPPVTFQNCEQQLVIFAISQGIFDFDNLPERWKCPHKLVVYSLNCKMRGSKLSKLDSSKLPQGIISLYSNESADKSVVIVAGTTTALKQEEISVSVHTETNESCLENDSNELRIYEWKKCHLCLKCSINTNTDVEAALIVDSHKKDSLLFISQKTKSYSENITSILQSGKLGECCDIKCMNLGIPINNYASLTVDKYIKYLLIGTASSKNNNNVILFKIN